MKDAVKDYDELVAFFLQTHRFEEDRPLEVWQTEPVLDMTAAQEENWIYCAAAAFAVVDALEKRNHFQATKDVAAEGPLVADEVVEEAVEVP